MNGETTPNTQPQLNQSEADELVSLRLRNKRLEEELDRYMEAFVAIQIAAGEIARKYREQKKKERLPDGSGQQREPGTDPVTPTNN